MGAGYSGPVGPLPRFTNGHTWLLVMQDRFTKWVELSPLRRATALAVVQKLTERIIYRHGCPQVIISDNGKQFTARQMQRLLQSFEIQQRMAPVHAPHCNPVERTNKTIKTMIAQYGSKSPAVGLLSQRTAICIQHRTTRGNGIHTSLFESWTQALQPPPRRSTAVNFQDSTRRKPTHSRAGF